MKMKNFLFIVFSSFLGLSQIPAGYYNSANGLTGYPLKTELKNIISNGYNAQTYNSLLNLYTTSDNDAYYDGGNQTNTILDIYSENPNGSDPYNYVGSQTCGNYNSEGDCFNREHIFPQGFFNSQEPMRSDAHHVVPTDGFVNGGRGNLPFGIVNPNASNITTYSNGSKKGNALVPNYNGDVFEPIDEFKGDVARMLLYFATRYEDNYNDSSWDNPNNSNDPRDGSQNRFYEQWYIDLLLIWHQQDPVSQREIDRNNDIYTHQNNRNPFIDNPAYVGMIWTSSSNPSGSIFPTLSGTFVDVNANGVADVGDKIEYTYTLENIGATTLYNISATANKGTFNTPNAVSSLNGGDQVTDPYGVLSYTLTANDLASSCSCINNQISVTAFFNQAGTNGSLTVWSDDPNNFANTDSNGDLLPDDITTVNITAGSTGAATDLFISEYIEGSGDNKAIEIANFTGATINLADYTLQISFNGGGSWSNSYNLTGTIADQDVYVLARGSASSVITAQADVLIGNSGPLNFNGNDAVGLFRNGVLLDVVGDPGDGSNFAKDETLIRKPNINSPNVTFNKPGEWNILGTNDSSDLGSHTFSTASINDASYGFDIALYPNPSKSQIYINTDARIISIRVWDIQGRLIKIYNQNTHSINLSNTGMYLVEITTDNLRITKRIIIQ